MDWHYIQREWCEVWVLLLPDGNSLWVRRTGSTVTGGILTTKGSSAELVPATSHAPDIVQGLLIWQIAQWGRILSGGMVA